MSYIGQGLPDNQFIGYETEAFSGSGSANQQLSLSKQPFSESSILVVINNVVQRPTTDYAVSGSTVTLVGTVASGDVIYVTHLGATSPIGEASALDLGGQSDKLILDTDGDTTISADTDDQIDVKIGGTDALRVTGTALTGNAVATIGATGTASTLAGIPFYSAATSSIYTHDVSGTDDGANYNTAYGIGALDAVTTGDTNVAIGYNAGTAIQDGEANTLLGTQAGQAVTSPAHNTLLGYVAGGALTTGATNIAIGSLSLDGCDTESNNLAIGFGALGGSVAGGEYNVAVGNYALDALTSADKCVAIGYSALTNCTTGGNNVAIGRLAGDAVVDEDYTVCIGEGAGDDYIGAQSIMIGAFTRHHSSGDNEINAICIGYNVNTGRGNQVHLGNTSVTAIKGQVSFSTYSDERIKRDIVDGDLGLEFIEKLKPRKFKRKEPKEYADLFGEANKTPIKDEEKELVFDGLIAQEVEQTCKELGVTFSGHEISQNTGNKQSIQYETLVVPLIKAVQELSAKVKELESK